MLGTRYPAVPNFQNFLGTRYPAVPNFSNFLGTQYPAVPKFSKFRWVPGYRSRRPLVINSKSENIGVNLIINLESIMLEIRTWIVIEHRARKFELGFFTRPVLTPGRPGNFEPGIPILPTKIIFCARIIYLWIDLIKISILSKNHNL